MLSSPSWFNIDGLQVNNRGGLVFRVIAALGDHRYQELLTLVDLSLADSYWGEACIHEQRVQPTRYDIEDYKEAQWRDNYD